MQPAVLRALEFDRIREALAHEALTPLGRERALTLDPAVDLEEVQRRLTLTGEAVQFRKNGGSLALSAPEEIAEIVLFLNVEDQPLEPVALLGLARLSRSIDAVVDAVAGASQPSGAASAPVTLSDVAARASSFAAEAAAIERAIDPSGEVNDDASPALREIRDKLRRLRSKLRTTLEGLTRSRESSKYLQDQIVTDRSGRYVVVVRAEHREAIPGIVHGSSASGASLYVEPLSTVEVNNEIVELAEREVEEVRRILLGLTNAFRRRPDELTGTLEAAADFDELHAKARLAARLGGQAPRLTSDGRLELLGARHPLLKGTGLFAADSKESAKGIDAIPSDLLLMPPTNALVISGPNTGGKTVALKAVGLLVLMAQAGLLIPVEPGSALTPFRTVFADIGDEQSISASLSTFSARVANVVAMDGAMVLPALVLLDEVGSGTDPVEGGALGTAVIDHFRRRGALVVATTHDDALKSYAATTEGVSTAAFGFDPETYAPTYRLVYGAPGRSLAVEIAERLGMPASVIADARSRRSGRESLLASHLARVDRELATLERERAETVAARTRLAGAETRVLEREARLAEREAVLKRRLDDRLNEKLREARAEVDRIVGQLKEKATALSTRTRPLSTGDIGQLSVEGRSALDAVGAELTGAAGGARPDDRLDGAPAVGQSVFVTTFGAEGIVRGVSGSQVEVEIRGKRTRVAANDLRRAARQDRAPVRPRPQATTSATGLATPVTSRELVLIGSTVDAALDRVEKFLDAALLADERRLRIVHGHGTGRLREALRTFFKGHTLVASVAPAPDNEGGDGATIVELKD